MLLNNSKKDNEICYSEYNGNKICFFDLLKRKIKASEHYKLVRKIEVPDSVDICEVCMINKNMLFTGDQAKIVR